MTTQDYAASVQGVAIRVTRLDSVGNLMAGAMDSYTTSSFIRVSFTPEYEEGDEITEKAADGTVCVTFKAPDTLKRVTMEVAICDPDPEFTALVSGGLLLTRQKTPGQSSTTQSVGWAAGQVGQDPSGDGVAVEAWSYAVQNGKKAPVDPYYHWIFPYVKVRQSGDRVIENGLLANTFEGFGLGNINFYAGPDGKWEWPAVADRPYMFARDDWAPIGYKGFYSWPSGSVEGTALNALTDPGGTNVPGSPDYAPGQPVDYMLQSSQDTVTGGPTITTVAPATGPIAGGTAFTITGTNLTGATSVRIGNSAATQVNATSATSVSATSPAGTSGAKAVSVTTPDGTATKAAGWTYTP